MHCILVTGSEGLIGKSLRQYLESKKISVRGLDNKLPPNHAEYGDILDKKTVNQAVDGCSGIIHLAASSRVIFGEQTPSACWNYNVDGTTYILEAALNSPKKPWVIYASSREVYGQQEILPVSEDAPLKPMNMYARSKVAAERKVMEAGEAGLLTAILRFSNVFGSVFDHHDRVIPAFCRAALRHQPLRLEGKNNIFDFTFISDVIEGISKASEFLETQARSLPPIHFTTGRGLTLHEAARIIINLANSTSNIIEKTPRAFDVSYFYGDFSRAKSLLNWSPQIAFEEAIKKYLALLTVQLEEESVSEGKLT